ncbi:RPL27A [Bugula neritina]|uniref:Large ribosomal subunit protein uL15 n=1 Tax=Bugula neritina TaxID=10212 RepID=A0A7J7KFC1_BUGNE|nr:RPL27A [Bugula neritina]
MRNFHVYAARSYCPTINIDKLWTLVPTETKDQLSKDKAPVIDCVRAGFYKVLGKGTLPSQPVIVKAKFFSRGAEEKIKSVGGACICVP